MRRVWVLCVLAGVSTTVASAQPRRAVVREVVVASPNQQLIATVAPVGSPDQAGPWRYRVDRDVAGTRVEVLGWAPLGVVREDASLVDMTLVSVASVSTLRDTYEMPAGKRRARASVASERQLTLEAASGARVVLTFRVSDASVAFRYSFPHASTALRRLKADLTGFALPAGSRGWLLPHDPPGRWTPAYEGFFTEVAAGAAAPTPQGWSYPALFHLPAVRSPESEVRSPS